VKFTINFHKKRWVSLSLYHPTIQDLTHATLAMIQDLTHATLAVRRGASRKTFPNGVWEREKCLILNYIIQI